MRRFTALLIALLSVAILHAEQPHKVYCTITGSNMATAVNGNVGRVKVDYGQERNYKDYLVDENGEHIYFESMLAALNYMAQFGWELVTTDTKYERNTLTPNLDTVISVWILTKTVTSEAEITEGFMTRNMLLEGQQP